MLCTHYLINQNTLHDIIRYTIYICIKLHTHNFTTSEESNFAPKLDSSRLYNETVLTLARAALRVAEPPGTGFASSTPPTGP